MKRWTKEEEEIILSMVGKDWRMTDKQKEKLAKELGRSIHSIKQKLFKLKARANKKPLVKFPALKKCKECKKEKPRFYTHFIVDENTKDGLRDICKKCYIKKYQHLFSNYKYQNKKETKKDPYKKYEKKYGGIKHF